MVLSLYKKQEGDTMASDKIFLSYNQQMRKLRNNKKIECSGTQHKIALVRSGYFNIINGYKMPFTCGTDVAGNHIYFPNTSLEQIYELKKFDEALRNFLLKYITQVEEEVRTLTGYKFDECNEHGKIPWYETNAYSEKAALQAKMSTISSAYSELSKSHSEYVKFYMKNHEQIPTWIMIKVVNFSTFINVLSNSKQEVTHAICTLYSMLDANQKPNVKLLIGSLHWLRKVRNSCAHNERVYCIRQEQEKKDSSSGRILDPYYEQLPMSYKKCRDKNIFDLLIYFKYYLPKEEYSVMIFELKDMLVDLKNKLAPNAFDNVRGQMGIKDISVLDTLENLSKNKIEYNKFDTF